MLSQAALAKLLTHRWPGNVRELENVVARAMVLHENKIIEGHDISFDDLGLADEAQKESLPASVEPHRGQANYSSELTGILSALQASTIAPRQQNSLGISPRTLRQKLFEFRKARTRSASCIRTVIAVRLFYFYKNRYLYR